MINSMNKALLLICCFGLLGSLAACAEEPVAERRIQMSDTDAKNPAQTELATLGAGCFWCVEAVFQRIDGVSKVIPGYTGGQTPDPTYRDVCGGETGHAEVAQITYDPKQVSFAQLLEVFWQSHDPTTLNRQGADVGTQYRSAIFYHSEEQRQIAEKSKQAVDASGSFANPVVTEISALGEFYEAEDYHQDYYERNKNAAYCQYVIRPKLKKLGLE